MSDLAWMRALTERIEAARRGPGDAPQAGPALQVVFQAGAGWYALPLEAVREVVLPRPPFARVPGTPPAVLGAMNLRGRVVAVVELATLLGDAAEPAPGSAPGQQHVVLLDRGRADTGLLVGAVLGVEPVAEPPLARPSRGREGSGEVHPGVPAGAEVVVLDPDEVEARAAALFG